MITLTAAAAPVDSDAVTDAQAIELWGRVIHGFQATNRRLHADLKNRFGLNEAEVETLLSLYRCPERRSRHNSLATGAGFTTGGFTKIADRLTERGLTIRTACETDRRVSYLQLTDDGESLAGELTRVAAGLNRELFIGVLGQEQAQAVADAMTLLYRANHAEGRH